MKKIKDSRPECGLSLEDKESLHSCRRVVSNELDSFGHVNNAVYLQYLEAARNDFLWQKGLDFYDFFRWQKFPVVASAHLEFRNPARAGDYLEIRGHVVSHSATSFTLKYQITNSGNGSLVLEAETFHVFVDSGNRPVRIPQEFMKKFITSQQK